MLTRLSSPRSNSDQGSHSSTVGLLVGLLASVLVSVYYRDAIAIDSPTIAFQSITYDNGRIHYAFAGDPNKLGVLFVHGTPGDWTAFSGYLANTELQKLFFMVSVDRPSWGLSSNNNSATHFNFNDQATAINQVMQYYPDKEWIVVGHSLGASLAPEIALQANNKLTHRVRGLLLLAGSLNPQLGYPRWYNHLANTMLLKWLVPSNLRKSNHEIMRLHEQLTLMNQQINTAHLTIDVVVIQGLRDRLVSPRNTQFITDHWQTRFNSVRLIELADEGHFLPWRQVDLVTQEIKNLGGID